MHSIETSIVVSIAIFFFYTFLTFTFMREVNICKEIDSKITTERNLYAESKTNFNIEDVANIATIFTEGERYERSSENESND